MQNNKSVYGKKQINKWVIKQALLFNRDMFFIMKWSKVKYTVTGKVPL